MKELSTSGFMSNRGRQVYYELTCSFLVRDMGIDWRMGAEWFETFLLDYDPCSNYGNWTYNEGVGNDPRRYRYFNIPKQDKRNFPHEKSYIKQIVPLKISKPNHGHSHTKLQEENDNNSNVLFFFFFIFIFQYPVISIGAYEYNTAKLIFIIGLRSQSVMLLQFHHHHHYHRDNKIGSSTFNEIVYTKRI
ncbi:hypothetical protein MKW92_030409 [Papaver armeniacum]|nr:hypothetical protein MKW92_030409 [Papaver armeniacum]